MTHSFSMDQGLGLVNFSQPELSPSVFQALPIGVFYEGWDGSILKANPAFCHAIGYTEAQLRRLDCHAITHPEDFALELTAIRRMCCEGESKQTFRKRLLRLDGSIFYAEATLLLVGEPDSENGHILVFLKDLKSQEQPETELWRLRERETLLNDISASIRSTFNLPVILQTATERLRRVLETDRVVAYQIYSDGSGICLAESVLPYYFSMQGLVFSHDCIPPPYLEEYRLGRLWHAPNIPSEHLADCHQELLEQLQVKSMVAVGILQTEEGVEQHQRLWGLLAIHHCRSSRYWAEEEISLIRAVANQLTIAIEQANLLTRLQSYTHELEARVSQRTASLEQSLRFEQLIRRLTETMRLALDEDEVLKAAVEGLVQTLGVDGCYASLLNDRQKVFQVRYHHFLPGANQLVDILNCQAKSLDEWSDSCRRNLLSGKIVVQVIGFQSTVQGEHLYLIDVDVPSLLTSIHEQPIQLISPILDDQGLIGTLSLLCRPFYVPNEAELILIEQVSKQCAIAIRQARLFREEHQQRYSAEYFRQFLEKSPDVFVEYDAQFRYTSINPAGSALLGRPISEILGYTDLELLGDAGIEIHQLIQQAFRTGESVYVNHEVDLPTGTKIFETVYTPIPEPDGSITRVVGICRDVSEFRRQWQVLESQNHQLAETTRLKEEFIATTSHELRTPLTAILGFSNVLLQEHFGPLNGKQQEYVSRIHSSGQHLLDLINDILDLSRIEADRLELELQLVFLVDIYESVLSLIREKAQSQDLTVEIEVEPDLEYLIADPRRLKQMLLNLLTNAVKFTTEGAVGLKIYHTESKVGNKISPTIHFQVWDTGIGIQEADQKHLFSPFSQIDSSLSRRHQGTGLGLVITRKLAEIHGGKVELESSPGKGSRFTLSLPLYRSLEELP